MPDIEVGKSIVGMLKPLLPTRWKWFEYGTNLDRLDRTTVMLTFQELERMPEAPMVMRLLSCTLTIFTPLTAPAARDASLIDDLLDLLNAIDGLPTLAWSKASRVLGNNGQNLGYDITLQFRFNKEITNA